MATYPRESAFMPTVKCSQCGNEVEISMMGEHICKAASKQEEAPLPPPPAAGSDMLTGAFASLKQTVWGFGSRAAPPTVDTNAANEAFSKQDQLTPVSASTGSRTISPKTPSGRLDNGSNSDEYFSPAIADAAQSGRPGGYGGFGEPQPYEPEPMYYGSSPQKQAAAPQGPPSLLQRMNTIAPGPFEMNRKPAAKNAFAPPRNEQAQAPENYSDDAGMLRVQPRKNGYGGFGPPQQEQDTNFEPRPFGTNQRSETFPKQNQNPYNDVPERPPSAPGSRQQRMLRAPSGDGSFMTKERPERPDRPDRPSRPSFSMKDTSRPPPPRKSLIPPAGTAGNGANINLAAEFGSSNPYHTPSDSQSSNNSGYSMSQRSHTSSISSPPRSVSSRRKPSDTSANFDSLMNDLQTSMDSFNPQLSAGKPEQADRLASPSEDVRFDPAIQGGRAPPRPKSPLASPIEQFSERVDPAIQSARSRSPDRKAHMKQPSMGRSRGNCKACKIPITGKSISSADGRLTGRYHKACFVCTTCQSPFTSAEFYVLDDKPYDAGCYHRLNGSLCTTCGYGIEGQYLEDDSAHKHHPGCFRCGDCRRPLHDGYFEVNGRAYCERDAWRRVQPPPMAQPYGGRGGGMRPPPPNGSRLGLPGGSRLAPPGGRPRMEKRMTRLGMM
ncbi:hypothetical protein G7054_g752 [Neopestalotiopsis clavispora]|nr:hypothetical protein G7054_g752 [Neopestalotiopsis clavispora]